MRLNYIQKIFKSFTPIQWLFFGYIVMTFAGAVLLSLPISSAKGVCQPFIDAFFTSASAVTTTGLAVVDTGSFYNLFGQLVILLLTQIAGLGYMIFFAVIISGLGGKLSFAGRMLLRDSMGRPSAFEMVNFAKLILIITAIFEIGGGLILGFYWMRYFPPAQAFYSGFFHSISAFCTCGFGLYPDSLITYKSSLTVNLTIMIVSLGGAIGFFVFYDLYAYLKKTLKNKQPRSLSVHTKFVILLSILIIGIAALIMFVSESLKMSSFSLGGLMDAFFQSISASATAGFNTVNIADLTPTSLFTLIITMFIGASPGGTGAGIKTTSFGIIVLFLIALFIGKGEINIFKRKVMPQALKNSFAVAFAALLTVTLAVLIMTATEKTSLMNIIFEVVSALSNVGLTCGMTPVLTGLGKIVISIVMLIGRMGPLAIVMGVQRQRDFKYPEAEILIG